MLSIEEAKKMIEKKEGKPFKPQPKISAPTEEKRSVGLTSSNSSKKLGEDLSTDKKALGKIIAYNSTRVDEFVSNVSVSSFNNGLMKEASTIPNIELKRRRTNKELTSLFENNNELYKKAMKISRDYLRKKSDASASDIKLKETCRSLAESEDNNNIEKKEGEAGNAIKSQQASKVNAKTKLLKNKRKRDVEEFTIEENCLLDKLTKYLKFISLNLSDNLIISEKETIERVMSYFDKLQLPNPIETLKVK